MIEFVRPLCTHVAADAQVSSCDGFRTAGPLAELATRAKAAGPSFPGTKRTCSGPSPTCLELGVVRTRIWGYRASCEGPSLTLSGPAHQPPLRCSNGFNAGGGILWRLAQIGGPRPGV